MISLFTTFDLSNFATYFAVTIAIISFIALCLSIVNNRILNKDKLEDVESAIAQISYYHHSGLLPDKNDKINADFEMICKRYLDSVINNRDDLYVFYSNLTNTDFESFNHFLAKFLNWLLFSTEIEVDDKELSNENRIKIKQFIIDVSREENDKELFQDVSPDERSSLLAISSYTKSLSNYNAIMRELFGLSNSMKNSQRRIKVESRNNRLALALSLLSLLATVFLSLSTNSMLSKSMDKQDHLLSSVDSISRLYDAKTIPAIMADSVKTIDNNK